MVCRSPYTAAPFPYGCDTVSLPTYLPALMKLWRDGMIPRGQVVNVDVQHDRSCAYFRDGVCDCQPVVTVQREAA